MGKKKIIWGIVAIILLGGGYVIFKSFQGKDAPARYILGAVEKGTIVTSVTGSGQVSASNQIDIKPKVSGDVTYVGVKAGQEVKSGAIIASLNASDALKAVRDAQVNLTSAKLSLAKLQQPPDSLSLTQAENNLARAQESKQTTLDDLRKTYDDGFNDVTVAFLDLPGIMSGLQDILYGTTVSSGSGGQWNVDYYTDVAMQYDQKIVGYRTDAIDKYKTARVAYDKNFQGYKETNRSSDVTAIESIINKTSDTTGKVAEAIKSINNFIQFYQDTVTLHSVVPVSISNTQLTSLNTYTSKTNTHLSNLNNILTSIKNDEDAIINADRTINENNQSLDKLKAGTDSLDLQSSQLSVQQRQNALLDTQQKLADYTVRAPFDGIIAAVNVKRSDSASSGTALATIITKQKLAEVSLNEVDVAKVSVGQKVTLTFDAVDGLSVTGGVAAIDALGTVTQGVVSYKVTINFDTQDNRVKSGMSASAAIITEVKSDVLMVPNGAIKVQGGGHYVEILDNPILGNNQAAQGVTSATVPRQQTVEIGSSNDTSTEIISGLKEEDQIIIRTVAASTTRTSGQNAPSLFPTGGGNRNGGAVRIPG